MLGSSSPRGSGGSQVWVGTLVGTPSASCAQHPGQRLGGFRELEVECHAAGDPASGYLFQRNESDV